MAKQKAITKNNKPVEGFLYRVADGVSEIIYIFDSPFGRLIPIILICFVPLAIIAVKLDKFFEFGGMTFLLLIPLLYLFYKMPWAFAGSKYTVKIQQNMNLGQKDKILGPVEDAEIVKQTITKTFSAKAKINNPKEVKKLAKKTQ